MGNEKSTRLNLDIKMFLKSKNVNEPRDVHMWHQGVSKIGKYAPSSSKRPKMSSLHCRRVWLGAAAAAATHVHSAAGNRPWNLNSLLLPTVYTGSQHNQIFWGEGQAQNRFLVWRKFCCHPMQARSVWGGILVVRHRCPRGPMDKASVS